MPERLVSRPASSLPQQPGAYRGETMTCAMTPPTRRRLEVIRLLAEGAERAETAQIAHTLGLSPGTVRNHSQAAMERPGARTRVQAVMAAAHGGLLWGAGGR